MKYHIWCIAHPLENSLLQGWAPVIYDIIMAQATLLQHPSLNHCVKLYRKTEIHCTHIHQFGHFVTGFSESGYVCESSYDFIPCRISLTYKRLHSTGRLKSTKGFFQISLYINNPPPARKATRKHGNQHLVHLAELEPTSLPLGVLSLWRQTYW